MKPARLDFVARRGKPFHARLTYRHENGDPIKMAGWSGRLQVRRYPGAPVIAEISTAAGTMTLDDENGEIELRLPEEDTAAAPIINARHDLELRDSLDTPIIPVVGRFAFEGVITE
jgi:hypothetical protein